MLEEVADDLFLGRGAGAAPLADVDDAAIRTTVGKQLLAGQIITDNDFRSLDSLHSAQGDKIRISRS